MKQGFALSTDGMNGREAAQAWHDWMAMLFAGIDSDIYGDTSFEGRVRVEHAGDVVMTKLEAARHRVMRTVQSVHGQGADYLKIVAPGRALPMCSKVTARPAPAAAAG